MAHPVYECMLLLDPNTYARDPAGLGQKIHDLVVNNGGKVLASRLWNEQRLAYAVNGQRKGVYWLTYFEMDPEQLHKFERACRIHDAILRHLTLWIDPRLAEAMVSAARGGRTVKEPVAESKPAPRRGTEDEGESVAVGDQAVAET